jgi:hypothetical protein
VGLRPAAGHPRRRSKHGIHMKICTCSGAAPKTAQNKL